MVNILSQLNITKLKKQKLLAILAIVSIAWLAACVKDTYKEILGVCPVVVSVNPVNGAKNIPFNQVITVKFNEKMNPATINQETFTLHGATAVEGAINYSDSSATFTPASRLLPNTTYTGRISTLVRDATGNAIQSDYVWTFSTAAFFVDLQSAARFGIIAATGVINIAGQSEIHNLDVGLSPGFRNAIVGFPPAILVNGALYAANDQLPTGIPAMLITAKKELSDAYLHAESLVFPASTTLSGDIGGRVLAPGIYKSSSSLLIQSGDLTLDAQGDPNAVWVFQIESGLTTIGGAGGSLILTGGANANNIIWQVGSSAVIGDFTSFKGNVLANTSITMNAGATTVGRMLAMNGAVVLTSNNKIQKP